MLAISIVLFVVPDNSHLVIFQHYFTYRISLFRNQSLNIQKKTVLRQFNYAFKAAFASSQSLVKPSAS